MTYAEFEVAFKECAALFGIDKACRDAGKEYDLGSMMMALGKKVHDAEEREKERNGVLA